MSSSKSVLEQTLSQILSSPPPSPITTTILKAQLITKTQCDLAEGILYDDLQNQILWTDINLKTFYKLSLSTYKLESFSFSKKLCSFALLGKGGEGYLCAWEDGFQLYDIEHNKEMSPMSVGEDVNPLKGPTRLNDGRCDPTGRRFICGGANGDISLMDVKMKVFACEYNSQTKQLVHTELKDLGMEGGVQITNSLCFSPDGNTMYFTNSPTKTIYKYNYDKETGTVSNKSPVWEWKHAVGFPDGSCVDEEGCIWNAVWRSGDGPGKVHRIDPKTRNVLMEVHMPDETSQCTCCCFGGPDLDILFITTAAENRDLKKEVNSGGIYAVKVGVKGRKESRFMME